jgi:uncharacterized phage infection (PIP) family protein YhgE
MRAHFEGYKELFDFAKELQHALAKKGSDKEAQELAELLNGYWSTASEALGDFLDSLNNVRDTVSKCLPDQTGEKLDLAIDQIREAIDRANNPN